MNKINISPLPPKKKEKEKQFCIHCSDSIFDLNLILAKK